jgi:fatty-acyl-CoA synthase
MPLRYPEPAEEAYPFQLIIRHILDNAVKTAADQEIVYRDQVRLTYRDLRARVGRLASVLAGVGVEEGATVAVMDWDSHRYLEAYFAVPMMGAVLQTVNVRLAPAQIAYTLDHGGADVLIVHRDFWPLVEKLLPDLPAIKTIIAILDGVDDAIPGWAAGEYEALLDVAAPDYPFRDFDENALATTFYTTGTTGNPKGVCFTHRQIVLLTLANNAPFGVTRRRGFGVDDIYMPLTPMFHVHAWGVPYLATMLGVKQVYPGRYDPDMLVALRQREGVTFSHCVPTILQMIFDAADRRGVDLSGWLMRIGGSATTSALWREGRRRGMELVGGYGMSESAPTIAVARLSEGDAGDLDREAAALTSAGVPIPLVSVRLVDESMDDVPWDGVSRGEIVVRSPWLTSCYVDDSSASDLLWQGGWLHTQDVGTIDAGGRIVVLDRLKDVIKTGGEWVGSLEIEELIGGIGGIVEISVIGVPDPRWGERPIAIAVISGNQVPTLDALNAPILAAVERGAISRYAQLDRLVIVDALPKTSVGKVDKKALRAHLVESAASQEW